METQRGRPRWHGAIESGAILVCMLAVVVALQLRGGAYGAGFSDDDSSHVVSGLMVHDFLVNATLRSPLSFLVHFYSHYPLVGIGHWPPLYYGLEGVWMLVAPASHTSLLVLSALVTAATATLTYALAAPRSGRLLALGAALVLVACPIVQEGSNAVMLDMPLALVSLLAAMTYGRYLRRGLARDAATFGIVATAAIMVKGNGIALGLLPLFAVAIGRRFALLRTWGFWLPSLIVGVLCAPWYVLTYGSAEAGFRFAWGLDYMRLSLAANSEILLAAVGPLLLAAGVLGFGQVVLGARSAPKDPVLVSLAALLAAFFVFQMIVPAAIQDRYLAPALPPLLILAAGFVHDVALWARRPWVAPALGAVLLLSFLPAAAGIPTTNGVGLAAAARAVWGTRVADNPSVLVALGPGLESAAIAELALDDPKRPSLFAVRATRLLGAGGYNNQDYAPRYQTPQEVMAAIDANAIPLVLLRTDDRLGGWTHLRQVDQARHLFPDRFELVWQGAGADPFLLFQVRGNDRLKADTSRLESLSAPRKLVPSADRPGSPEP